MLTIGYFKAKIARFRMLCLDRVGFWSGGMYDFSVSGETTKLTANASLGGHKWLVVVGRAHYFESVKDYPVGSIRDLKRVISNEAWRFPFKGLHFYKVLRVSDASHRVTSWIIKSEIFDSLTKKPLFLIPETACFDLSNADAVFCYERLGEVVYVSDTPTGIKSSLGQKESFFRELGSQDIPTGAGPPRALSSEVPSMVLAGAFGAIVRVPLNFFVGLGATNLPSYPWRRAMTLSGLLFATYMAVASLYLWAGNVWVERKLVMQRERAELSLSLRSDIASYRSKLESAHVVLDGIFPLWVTWDVFIDLTRQGVNFRGVNATGADVTFIADAKKASDVLGGLSEDERVESAEFVMPIRKVMDIEQFVLRASFVAGTTVSEKDKQASPDTTNNDAGSVDGISSDLDSGVDLQGINL